MRHVETLAQGEIDNKTNPSTISVAVDWEDEQFLQQSTNQGIKLLCLACA
jgi:hypothetical protein